MSDSAPEFQAVSPGLASRISASRFRKIAVLGSTALLLALFSPHEARAQCTGVVSVPVLGAGNINITQDATGLASFSNSIISVLNTMNTAFVAQGSAFVASPPGAAADQTGTGAWARGIGGHVETKGTGTIVTQSTPPTATPPSTPNVTCNTELKQNFWGVQVGQDLGKLNIGGDGWNVYYGITAGYGESKAAEKNGPSSGKFEVPFVGVYTTASKGNFFSDFMTRVDFYQMTLDNPAAGLFNQGLSARSVSFSTSAGYQIALPNNWFIEPSVGLIHSITKVDPISTSGTAAVTPGIGIIQDIESTLGRAGGRVGTTISTDTAVLQPFATASVWHEFQGNVTSTFSETIPGFQAVSSLTTTRVGTYGQYSVGLAEQFIGTGWVAYLRGDYRNGRDIEGWGVNGGVRYQFDPPKTAAAAARGGINKAPVKAAPAAPYNWTGLHVGGLFGTTWGETKDTFLIDNASPNGVRAGTFTYPRYAGLLGGAEIGYDYQVGNWVYGIAADIDWSNAKGAKLCPTAVGSTASFQTCEVEGASPIVTATGRAGYAFDRALVYAKGGAAWMRATYSEVCNLGPNEGTPIFPSLGNLSCINNLPPVLAPDPRGAATVTLLGWVAGVGFEYGFAPNWSAKVEYTYMDFGTKRMVLSDGWPVDVKNAANILKVGVNFRFAGLGPAGSPGSVDPKLPRPMQQNWIGCYLGIEGGGAWGRSRADSDGFTAFGGFPPPPPGPRSVGGTMTGNFNANGAVVGGTTGCGLLQSRDWVLGVESDLSWSSLKGTAASLADPTERNEVKENWVSTWRPRFGATFDDWLVYATGGLAVAEIEYTVSRPGATTVSEKHTRPGWAVGGGVERAFNQNWSLKVEYLYADFGREPYLDPPPTPIQYVTRSGGVFLNEHIVRAGINYKFDRVVDAAK